MCFTPCVKYPKRLLLFIANKAKAVNTSRGQGGRSLFLAKIVGQNTQDNRGRRDTERYEKVKTKRYRRKEDKEETNHLRKKSSRLVRRQEAHEPAKHL